MLMQRTVVAVLLGLMCALAIAADSSDGDGASRARLVGKALIGKPGPAAQLSTIDGTRIDLAQLYGKKPVYLKFWATWCVPCREQMPGFEEIYKKYGDRIAVVAVNTGYSDTEADVRAFRKKYDLHMPVVVDDGTLGAQLDLRVTPQHILIGRDGRVAHVGHLDDKQLHDVLERVLVEKGEPVALAPSAPAPHEKVLVKGDAVKGLGVKTLTGKKIALGDGKPRALMFFSPWCESYLRESRPETSQACRRVREDAARQANRKGVEWIGVAGGLWSSEKELAAFARENHMKMPVALDKSGEVFRAFGIRQIPSVVLIDAQGRVAGTLGPEDRDLAGIIGGLAK